MTKKGDNYFSVLKFRIVNLQQIEPLHVDKGRIFNSKITPKTGYIRPKRAHVVV